MFLFFSSLSLNTVSPNINELCIGYCSASLVLDVLRGARKTLAKIEIHEVELRQEEEAQELLEDLISCEILEELHIKNVSIPKFDFRFVTQLK